MRLNRYLSLCGLGSRRGCELLIQEGRVSINGHMIKDLATQVSDEDRVVADGKPVKAESGVVIALNKPRGYICSRSDEKDRMTIYSLLPKHFQTLHHVGRLDKDSEGLLLMTNRGELSHRLIHPSMGAEKEYEVVVDKPMDQATMAKLVKGMMTEEGHAKCERAWMDTEYRAHLVLKQGLKRQIRLMFYQLGFEVERLVRTRIGWLELKGLQKGGWKQLTEIEVERFFSKDGATGRPSKSEKRAVSTSEAGESPRPRRPATKKAHSSRTASPAREGRSRSPRRASSFEEGESPRGQRNFRGRPDAGDDRQPRGSRFLSADREERPASANREERPRSRSTDREDRPRTSRSRFSKDEAAPRSRKPRSDSDRKTRAGASGRSSENKPRSPRGATGSRPQRASVKRSSGKKGSG